MVLVPAWSSLPVAFTMAKKYSSMSGVGRYVFRFSWGVMPFERFSRHFSQVEIAISPHCFCWVRSRFRPQHQMFSSCSSILYDPRIFSPIREAICWMPWWVWLSCMNEWVININRYKSRRLLCIYSNGLRYEKRGIYDIQIMLAEKPPI